MGSNVKRVKVVANDGGQTEHGQQLKATITGDDIPLYYGNLFLSFSINNPSFHIRRSRFFSYVNERVS